MAGRGGKRPGAGRKPSGLRLEPRADSPIRIADLKLAKHLPDLIDRAVEIALKGDKAMLAYCIDRVMGKAMQPVDHSGAVDHKVESVETIRRAIGIVA